MAKRKLSTMASNEIEPDREDNKETISVARLKLVSIVNSANTTMTAIHRNISCKVIFGVVLYSRTSKSQIRPYGCSRRVIDTQE